ncbi:MAG: DsrE family protein [Candidatus Cloacimonetes bacterium]|nr:DsrE family protein [Candidatus Cloacimonadota bacterium]NLO11925.1 DsrE family protein [Candidatus Cloacimonadota bacterium]
MKILVIFNHAPYDGSDLTYNGLRLVNTLLDKGHELRVFLMNDAVDLARDICKKPEGYDQDLGAVLKELIKQNVSVKVCGSCMARCGIHKNHPYFDGAEKSTMANLAEWVESSDKVLTF